MSPDEYMNLLAEKEDGKFYWPIKPKDQQEAPHDKKSTKTKKGK